MSVLSTSALVRERLRVHGVVQGVGFRPFVHALATKLGLSGFVGNDAAGVLVELEGSPEGLAEFRRLVVSDAPRLAVVDSVDIEVVPVCGGQTFTIVVSQPSGAGGIAMVPPDVAACEACLAEIADRSDRRYRYPFGNCTDCGPRFTVITAMPYDRDRTTMVGFALCAPCAAERADPNDRRFHAEPTACPACGPVLSLQPHSLSGEAALRRARNVLAEGGILAVKGLGGYHLACDATNAGAVQELRRRKARPDKPFALLVGDLDEVRRLALVDEVEAATLSSPARPIVLLRARADARIAAAVAPGLDEVGVQLPSTPLHVLLLEPVDARSGPVALVLTSGNLADEPIAYGEDAGRRLGPFADAFLSHDRPVHLPCDDSVVRVVEGVPTLLRRSRGYAPLPVRLSRPVRPVLAVGGDLKAAVCLAAGTDAWPGQHIGDLGSLEGSLALAHAARHLVALLRIRPEIVACDGHPGYASVRLAEQLAQDWEVPLVRVQHHHAHIASALAEAKVERPAIGLAFDGTGYGCDASIWGGEVLLLDVDGTASRVGHLAAVRLPGGDAAVRRPARSALAHLAAANLAWDSDLAPVAACSTLELGIVRRQTDAADCPMTSSVGRLYDAVAALCGVRQDVSYEAQAALELEALSRSASPGQNYQFGLQDGVFDAAPVMRAVVADLRQGVPGAVVGARFTASLAAVSVTVAAQACAAAGVEVVALSGGVFANVALLRAVRAGLSTQGLRVVTHQRVPCGDGGLSLGQAVIAGFLSPTKEMPCV